MVVQKPYYVMYKMDRDGYGELIKIDGGVKDQADFSPMLETARRIKDEDQRQAAMLGGKARSSKNAQEFVQRLRQMTRVQFVQTCVLAGW